MIKFWFIPKKSRRREGERQREWEVSMRGESIRAEFPARHI